MSDLSNLRGYVRALIGDASGSTWADATLDHCLRAALGRYSAAVEHVMTKCIQLVNGGQYGLSLENWGASPALQEVAFLLWPAASSVAATTGENKIIDWWYYKSHVSGVEKIFVDLQIEGTTLPAAGDYILVTGVAIPSLEGLDGATVSTTPDTHFYILALGAAAYAWRSKEGELWAAATTYPTAYHVGMLAEMADDAMREFEAELEKVRQKRLERPPWGIAERRRMRRNEAGR